MDRRLDILLYAHDGRGLGHVSRSAAVGMALRRLYPHLRLLLVTGSARAGELIGPAPLDWLKLPAYASRVEKGRIRSVDGPSGFRDQELASLRSRFLAEIVDLYRPRLILCDHSPLGKHRELVQAQDSSADGRWFLGVRGVVGEVPQVFSGQAVERFKQYFGEILWYGDPQVLGPEVPQGLASHFRARVRSCGYVARLAELAHWLPRTGHPPLAGTVSLPWLARGGGHLVQECLEALAELGPGAGTWHLYLGKTPSDLDSRNLPGHVQLRIIGPDYARSLAASRCALIFGGTNSLTDVLGLGLPSLVLRRAMQDREQEEHLRLLAKASGRLLTVLPEEEARAQTLYRILADRLETPREKPRLDLDGAARAARCLASALEQDPSSSS